MNLNRILVIASSVLREVLRDRIAYLALLFASGMIGASLLLPETSAGAADKIILDLGLAGIGLFGLMVAVFIGTGLLNKEIEQRTVLILIAKPMSRAEFIIGKHVGLSAVLAVLTSLMTIIFLLVLSLQQFDYPLGSILVAAFFIALELSLITAVAILFGVFTSSLIAAMLTFAVFLMGHFSQNLVTLSNSIETQEGQYLFKGLYLIFPDLSRLDVKNLAVYDALPSLPLLLVNVGYGLIYIVLLLAVATFLFSRREF